MQTTRTNDIRQWFENNGIPTIDEMKKAELLILIKIFNINRTHYIDKLL